MAYSVVGSSVRQNTIYYNWVLEASKDGYETYKATFNIAKDIEEEITLAPKKGVKMIKIGNKFIGT